jgi:crotonobetainyl-CoA:carnitine CoA-transferase CaiB-like acyl-CoA transferase
MDGFAADIAAWAECGAMALTGPAEGPPCAAPAALAAAMATAADDLAAHASRWGKAVVVDGPALLGERAAITGMTRNGDVSVGGAARFVASADGWVVLNLPRPEDVASLPALVAEVVAADDWPRIAAALRLMSSEEIVQRATWLGMAVGMAEGFSEGPATGAPGRVSGPTFPARELHRGGVRSVSGVPLVIDLSSLWAGPLAASLLGAAGARVIKVEGRSRPDGARRGAPAFFDLLNSGKECVQIDFRDREDRGFLRRLLSAADLVVEASRPRVMDELRVSPEALADLGTCWLSLPAYGRRGPAAERIGFGDDTAVAGGLFVAGAPPMFVADAVADPIAGLAAAAVAAELLAGERAAVVEVPLVDAAAWAALFPELRPAAAAAPAPDPAEVVMVDDRWMVMVGRSRVAVASPRHRGIPPAAESAGSHDSSLRAEFAGSPG